MKNKIDLNKFLKSIENEYKNGDMMNENGVFEIVDNMGGVVFEFENLEDWMKEGKKVKDICDLEVFWEKYKYDGVYSFSEWLKEYCLV